MNLENIFTLSHRAEVYLPSKKQNGESVGVAMRKGIELEVGKRLTDLFGGATATEAFGFYKHLDGRTSLEGVTIVYAFIETLDEAAIAKLIDLAQYVKASLDQESVMLTLDGKAYFI